MTIIEDYRQIIIKPTTKWTDICGSVKGLDMETARKQLDEMHKDDEERNDQLEEAAKKIKNENVKHILTDDAHFNTVKNLIKPIKLNTALKMVR